MPPTTTPAVIPPHNIPPHHLNANSSQVETGSSCHQCKSRRAYYELIYCTQQQRKKKGNMPTVPIGCRKKYCEHCLIKFYQEQRPNEAGLKTWICPSCRHECSCAACRKKGEEVPTQWGSTADGRLAREDRSTRGPGRPSTHDYYDASPPPLPPLNGTKRSTRHSKLLQQQQQAALQLQQQQQLLAQQQQQQQQQTMQYEPIDNLPFEQEQLVNAVQIAVQHTLDPNQTNSLLPPSTHDTNSHSPKLNTNPFAYPFTTTATGLQSPLQTSSNLYNGPNFTNSAQSPSLSTQPSLNQHHNQHQTTSTTSQQQSTQQQSQQLKNLQPISTQASPHLAPVYRPSTIGSKSPSLLPNTMGHQQQSTIPTTSLAFKGSPPFNALTLTSKSPGGGANVSPINPQTLLQNQNHQQGGTNNNNMKPVNALHSSLFDPCPNPLLSSLIGSTKNTNITGTTNNNTTTTTSSTSSTTTTNNNNNNNVNINTNVGSLLDLASPLLQGLNMNKNLLSNTNNPRSPSHQPIDVDINSIKPLLNNPSLLSNNPPSSLFGSVTAPNSGLLTSINGINARLLLTNIQKDFFSLNQDDRGALIVNVNGQPLFSFTGSGTITNNGQATNYKLNSSIGLNIQDSQHNPHIFGSLLSTDTTNILQQLNNLSDVTFSSLNPRQQSMVVASTILEVLANQRELTQNMTPIPTPTDSTTSTTTTSTTSTPTTQLTPTTSEQTNQQSIRELKEVLDIELMKLQTEHKELLAFVDKNIDKVSKNHNKCNISDHNELTKHLSSALKRIQSEISTIQYKLEQLHRRQQVDSTIVQNESVMALFAIIWMVVNTPDIYNQIQNVLQQQTTNSEQGNNNDITMIDKITYIYNIIDANLKQQSTTTQSTTTSSSTSTTNNNDLTTSSLLKPLTSTLPNQQNQLQQQLQQLQQQQQQQRQIVDEQQNHFSSFSLGQSKVQAEQQASLNQNHNTNGFNSINGTNSFNSIAPANATKRKLGTDVDIDTRPTPLSPGIVIPQQQQQLKLQQQPK